VRRVRTRYSWSVRSGQRDGSAERAVCGSKEVACEARRCAAAVSVAVVDGGDGGDGVGVGGCDRSGSAAAAADRGGDGHGEVATEILIRK